MKPLPWPARLSVEDMDLVITHIPEELCEEFEAMVKYCARKIESAPECKIVMADCGMSVRAQRALLIACAESGERAFVSCIAVDSDGKTFDGWESAAALVLLQSMGASAMLLAAHDEPAREAMDEILMELRVDAKIPIGYIDSEAEWKILGYNEQTEREEFVSVSNGCAHLLDATFDVDAEVYEFMDFPERILELENAGCNAFRAEIGDDDELDIFCKEEYMIKMALCLSAPNEQLFAGAIRAFCGRAMYDGTSPLDADFLASMTKKYGLIIL